MTLLDEPCGFPSTTDRCFDRAGAEEQPNRSRHLRPRDGGEQRTTALELFFDLVCVFAVTQLSHLVISGSLRIEAIGRAAFLLLVVWWAWIYTTWMVNWFDPRSVVVGSCSWGSRSRVC
jgi:low temperature requirement protein LtrA